MNALKVRPGPAEGGPLGSERAQALLSIVTVARWTPCITLPAGRALVMARYTVQNGAAEQQGTADGERSDIDRVLRCRAAYVRAMSDRDETDGTEESRQAQGVFGGLGSHTAAT